MKRSTANGLLFLIAVIWGLGFVVTKIALDANASPGLVNFSRGLLFAIFIVLFFYRKIVQMTIADLKVGLVAGMFNFGGVLLQTIGVMYTTPSNNAFLCSTYVVMIPFIAWIFYRKKPPLKSFISILICVLGMIVLTDILKNAFVVNIGDIYTFAGAVFYAGSIVYLSYGTKQTDPSIIAFILAMTQTICGFFYFAVVEGAPTAEVNWAKALVPLLFLGIFCSFVAQTVQVWAQKYTSATSAGLIMMLEGAFGSAFSVAFGFEPFTVKLVTGGVLILLSIFIMEVDIRQLLKKGRAEVGIDHQQKIQKNS